MRRTVTMALGPMLAVTLVAACARAPAPADAALPAPALPIPTHDALGFVGIARGIRVATTERSYEFDRVAKIVVVRLALDAVELDLRPLPEHRFRPTLESPDVDVAVNAGFFEPDFSPSGLMIVRGRELSPASPRGGTGVIVVERGRARLVAFDALASEARPADFALQCGPRLVESDGSVGILRDSGQRAARTALCIRDGGRTLDIVVAHRTTGFGGPGLRTLAEWLASGIVPGDAGCESALNLDGGPSTALVVRGHPTARRLPPGPVVWSMTVRALATP